MNVIKQLYHRTLPHWHPQNSIFFITFRLANSLPQAILRELQSEREREHRAIQAEWSGTQKYRELCLLEEKYFSKYDAWLDKCVKESPSWLAQESIAQLVSAEIQRLDGERYFLIAFCIMPNHVHLLIDNYGFQNVAATNLAGPTRSYPLSDSLRLLKGRTARFCNQFLGREGVFWHHESYDHVVRNEQEFDRILQYIVNNPVKAGLVSEWELWAYTYVDKNFAV